MHTQLQSFAVSKDSEALDSDAFKFFCEHGFVLLKNFIDDTKTIELLSIVDSLAEEELRGSDACIYGENLQRVWNLLSKDSCFHELLLFNQVDLWMRAIFDRDTVHQKYFLSSFQANILKPGAKAQILHTDTPIPEPIPPYPIKANTIWLLDDFTDENGATEVVPGSHTSTSRPPRQPTSGELSRLVKIIAPKGSLLITSGNLWHRAGSNFSGASRTVLLGSFAASYVREIACEDDTVRFLPDEMRSRMSPRLLQMIGACHGVKPGNGRQ